jgi:4-hydroxy-tetrahydrodipicolinate synthase
VLDPGVDDRHVGASSIDKNTRMAQPTRTPEAAGDAPLHGEAPFRGIWPALLTPLTPELDIDADRLAAHGRRLLEAGCGGVTPFGTTGEGPSFSVAERVAGVDALVARGVPASRILVSTSCAALPDVIALTRHALAVGAHGCLMLPPFFIKGVPEQGVIDAYAQVIERVADDRLRLYLYHLPQVSAVPLTAHVIGALKARYPRTVVGLKDSGCLREASLAFADAFMPQGLMCYVGNEPDLPELARRGSTGAVSGVANVMPRLVQRLIDVRDPAGQALALERVKALLAILFEFGLASAFKSTMALLDDHEGWRRVRAPLVPLAAAADAEVRRRIAAIGIDRAKD